MNSLDKKEDKGIPKLTSYLAAILNVKEKNLTFLPCYNGYLIFVDTKKPLVVWVHKQTIEGVLKVGFNLIAEEFIFKLIWGGKVLRELFKGVIPDAPTNTLIFYPGLHRINYGKLKPEKGTTGVLVKGFNKATELVTKTGKGLLNLLPNETKSENEAIAELNEEEKKLLPKTFISIQFQDFLYTTLSKEKLFKSNLPISTGFDFRSVFENDFQTFIKKIEKNGGFTIQNKGEKGFL